MFAWLGSWFSYDYWFIKDVPENIEKRKKILEELKATEKSYSNSLNTCIEVIIF